VASTLPMSGGEFWASDCETWAVSFHGLLGFGSVRPCCMPPSHSTLISAGRM
jgi:hypothetical protein